MVTRDTGSSRMIRMPPEAGRRDSMAGGRDEAVGSARSRARVRHGVGDVGLRGRRRRGRRRGRRRQRHLGADGQQPADGRPAEADGRQLHQADRHHGELHRAARERRPRQDQPGVLEPGGSVRRGLAVELRDPDLRQERLGRADGRLHREGRGVQPGRHPQADDDVAHRRGRQDLRPAVLRRVVVPDVPQGRLRRQGPHDARRSRPGSRWPTSRRRSTARSPT